MQNRLVGPLSAFGRHDLALAGGKGANLGELVRSGYPVPDGFAVTTAAYTEVVAGSGLGDSIAKRLAAEEVAEENIGPAIRADFESLVVPLELRSEVEAAYAKLGGGPVAVRSSATAEDLPGAAFAGQQDTYLGVVGEEAVLDAVRRCWASLWTDRALAYRRRLGIESSEVRIAVVVQRMVGAEYAGVLFTANPVTGDRGQIAVDASAGLGEAVVSGVVTPDHYLLDTRGRVKEWSPGRREVVIGGASGSGLAHDTQGGSNRLVADDVLADLARLGTSVADHFGRPQDIEWAYADGRVQLLQARPMTALPPPPVRLNPAQRRLGSVLLDYLPYRPYPIDMTTWLPYGPAGMMAKVAESFGIRRVFDGFIAETDGVVDRMVPSSPHPTPAVVLAPFRLMSRARRYDPGRWTEDPRFADYLARVRDLAGEDLAAMSWERLTAVPRRALDLVQPITDLRIDYLPRTGVAFLRLLVALTLLRRRTLLGDLVLGAPTRTEDANRALEVLAERVREDRRLTEAVEAADPRRVSGFVDFQQSFEAYLAEYGHRETASPLLVTPPTLAESPETVLGLIKVLAAERPRTAGRPDDAMRRLLDHPWLRAGRRRARVQRWVQEARSGLAFREDSHFYFTMPLPVLRRSLLEIGRRLCVAEVLDGPQEVFHLRLEELEDIGDLDKLGGPAKRELRAAVRGRSARREELSGVRLIDPGLIFPRRRETGDALVSGTPASGGTVAGPVTVIRDPAEFARLAAGDVLVCPYTNPSWTPLFQRAAAVVVDAGGVASHAAIVAREYGIPAIMGTAVGTTALTDGQVVKVDGDTGRVTAASAGGGGS